MRLNSSGSRGPCALVKSSRADVVRVEHVADEPQRLFVRFGVSSPHVVDAGIHIIRIRIRIVCACALAEKKIGLERANLVDVNVE